MKKIIPLLSVFMLLFMACPPKDGEEVAITLSPTTLELKVGETGALTASVTPAQAKIAGVKWSSSNTAVASVSSGTVTGVGEGTATITAESVQDPSKKASASVTVTNPYKDGFTISGDDFYNVNPMQTEVRFMLFNETDRFLNMVKECFPAAESAGFKYSDIIVKNIDAAENSLVLLTDPPLFVLGSPLSTDSFAVEKTAAVEPATEYTKKFALDLEVGGRTVKVTWVDGEGDVFTTPDEGEITFSASDVVYSVSEERKIFGTVNNLAKKLTAAGVTVDSGTVAVKITVGDQSVTTTAAAPTDSIAWNIDHVFDEGATLLTVELIFNGYNPAPEVAYQGFPVELTVQKSVVITPLEISLNRKTSTRGVPEAKLIAQFSYPDMEVLLDGADYLDGAYADYDFENATWSAEFADADNAGTAVATITNAPYGEPTETNLALDKDYNLKLIKGTLTVPARVGVTSVSFSLVWGSDALLGDSILIKHEAEFPEKLYFNASDNFKPRTEKKDGDTEYILVFGDDFNYTYNGLNYKSYAEWNEAKRSGDTKGITEFSRIWTTENENKAFTRRQATWDIRSAEVKNSHLFQKNMAADPSSGTIYLGANETKPLKGFTDLNQDGPVVEGATRAGEVLTGSVISDYVTYGYMTARVRTKANGYVSNSAVRGPWYAFWAHGPMHEFDIMEQLATNPLQFCNVNHYHNNWGGYGDQVNSVFYNTITMTNSDIKQNHWTLGLFWNQNNYAYYYNDQAYTVISTSDQITATRRILSIDGATVRDEHNGKQMSISPGNTGTRYSESGYTGTLKAVPSAPVNIFVSTEAGGSWGGANLSADTKRNLPTWLEVDYVAYYLPNVEVSAVTIPQELKEKYATVFTTTPSFTLTAEVTPNDVPTKDVIWSSDNPQAVEISADGTVTIVGSGSARITAVSVMDESKSDSFTITVSNDKVSVDSVAIEGNDAIDLDYMGTTTLTVTISPDDASVKNVEWTVAPEGIVELENADTETVTVNAVGSGTATITVTSVDNPEATDSVSVTIAPPTAPARFEAHGTTFDKVDSLEFSGDDGALPNYAVVEEVDGGEGRITFSGDQMVVNAGTKTKLGYTPQADKEFDFVLIHASYSGGTPNAYINNNGTGLPHLQYIRDTNKLQVFSADWTRSADTNFTFSGDPALYGIYADSGTYAFAIQKNCYESQELFEKLGSYDAVDFGSDKVEFVFEGSGTARIDYIGFYKAQNSLVDTSRTAGQSPAQAITRGGKNYTLVSTLFGEGNNAVETISGDLSFVDDGSVLKVTQSDTADHTVNLSVPDNTGNAKQITFIEVRAKIDGNCANSQAQLGLTWAGTFFRYYNGWKSGAWNAGNNSTSAISPSAGVWSLYGVALSGTADGTWTFFFDNQQTGAGTLKDGKENAVKGRTQYPFFYKFFSGSGASFEIDYIAFYTDSQ